MIKDMKNTKITCIIFEMVGKEWEGGIWYVPQEHEERFSYYIKKEHKIKKIGTFEFDQEYLEEIYDRRNIDENLYFYDATISY